MAGFHRVTQLRNLIGKHCSYFLFFLIMYLVYMQILLSHCTQEGSSPIYFAISSNHQHVVELLIEEYGVSPIDGTTNV